MKRNIAYVIGILACALTLSASAGPTVTISDSPYQAGEGGEFDAVVIGSTITGLPLGSEFSTFCLERNEYITLGNSYYAVVNTAAVNGGVGGQLPGTNTDPLDPRTAWLYNAFLNGTLTGYNYTDTSQRRVSAAALQNAIWYIEQEITCLPSGLATQFVAMANTSTWYQQGTIGNVRVMNMYRDANGLQSAQDVLCRTVPAVPAPGAILLTGLGTVIVGLVRRRRAMR